MKPSSRAITLFSFLLAISLTAWLIRHTKVVQHLLFTLVCFIAWLTPSLRKSFIQSFRPFFSRIEGRFLVFLCVLLFLSTLFAVKDYSHASQLWINCIERIFFVFFIFSLSAILYMKAEEIRRIFRLCSLFYFFAMILLVCILIIKLNDPSKLYYYYVQSGLMVPFLPFCFASFSEKGIGREAHNTKRKIYWRAIWILSVILFIGAAIHSERRLVAFGMLVGCSVLILSFFARKETRKIGLFLLLLLLAGGLLLFIYLFYYSPIYDLPETSSFRGYNQLFLPEWLIDKPRQIALGESIKIWKQKPWFGHGIHNANWDFFGFGPGKHPHNRFAEVLIAMGAIGLVFFLAFLGVLLYQSFQKWRKAGSSSALCLLLVHSVYWSCGLFDLSIWTLWHILIYITSVIMSLSLDQITDSSDAKKFF